MKSLILFMGLSFAVNGYAAETSVMSQNSIDNSYKLNQVGVGLQAGAFNGLNVEYWYMPASTVTASLTEERGNAAVSVGHNWMFTSTLPGWMNSLAPYLGVGAVGVFGSKSDYFSRTNASKDFILAAQVPLGLEWLPKNQRFSVFGQIAPSVEALPVLMGLLNADIGARFYF
jgi:hypothetical protein